MWRGRKFLNWPQSFYCKYPLLPCDEGISLPQPFLGWPMIRAPEELGKSSIPSGSAQSAQQVPGSVLSKPVLVTEILRCKSMGVSLNRYQIQKQSLTTGKVQNTWGHYMQHENIYCRTVRVSQQTLQCLPVLSGHYATRCNRCLILTKVTILIKHLMCFLCLKMHSINRMQLRTLVNAMPKMHTVNRDSLHR